MLDSQLNHEFTQWITVCSFALLWDMPLNNFGVNRWHTIRYAQWTRTIKRWNFSPSEDDSFRFLHSPKNGSFSKAEFIVHQVMYPCFPNKMMLTSPNWFWAYWWQPFPYSWCCKERQKSNVYLGNVRAEVVSQLPLHLPRVEALIVSMVIAAFPSTWMT